MRLFRFTKKKPEELTITRKVLIEKWDEDGAHAIQSLTCLLKNKIAPALAKEMEKAGFEDTQLQFVFNGGNVREWWKVEHLLTKRLCSGNHSQWDSTPYQYCEKINSYETYSVWATRAEKMVEKISEIKSEVEEIKIKRDSLKTAINNDPHV